MRDNYRVIFYRKDSSSPSSIIKYIEALPQREQARILALISLLQERNGYLEEPYTKHIKGKIRELIIDIGKKHHRIFYVVESRKRILLLHSFPKTTSKTPRGEIRRAEECYRSWKLN